MPASPLLEKITKKIEKADLSGGFSKAGTIIELRDGIAMIQWLADIAFNEIVEFPKNILGVVLDLSAKTTGVLILGDASQLALGDRVIPTGKVLSIPVGEAYIGRVVDGFAKPIDGKWEIVASNRGLVEALAPKVMDRQEVTQPVKTGIVALDSMIPIGHGQRELIIGDRQTGKTTLALDILINQAKEQEDVIGIYVNIGQKNASAKHLVQTLKEHHAMDQTIVVNAAASDSAAMQYLAPYVGCTLAEYFMHQGKKVIIVYDDLTKHAIAYREISLLLHRPPSREAYPGDIFYLHSRLLERAAQLNKQLGGGAITALPIVETLEGDISAYIPTNIISITDGQIYLNEDLFHEGTRPAIDVGLSVSRVGSTAQTALMKKVTGKLRIQLASFRELASFLQFGSEVNEETAIKIKKGQILTELFKQSQHDLLSPSQEIVLLYAWINDYLIDFPLSDIPAIKQSLFLKLEQQYSDLKISLEQDEIFNTELEKQIIKLIKEVLKEFPLLFPWKSV